MNATKGKGISLPCFSSKLVSDRSFWLPIAPVCNIRCLRCARKGMDPADPAAALMPDDAVARVSGAIERGETVAGAVIWGPGEPLLAASTYRVIQRLAWLYPDLSIAVSTNGLLLPDRLSELVQSGAKRVIVSVNALSPETAGRIYGSAVYRARTYVGAKAAELILQQQWNGLSNAVEAGLAVTAYIAEMPGVNDGEIPGIWDQAENIGVEQVVVARMRL